MFYQNFNQPLLPPGIDEEFIRTRMRRWLPARGSLRRS